MKQIDEKGKLISDWLSTFSEEDSQFFYIKQNPNYPICYFIAPLDALIRNNRYIPPEISTTAQVEAFYDNNKGIFSTGGGIRSTAKILKDYFNTESRHFSKLSNFFSNDLIATWDDYRRCFSVGLKKSSNQSFHWIFASRYEYNPPFYKLGLIDQTDFSVYGVAIRFGEDMIGQNIYNNQGQVFGRVTQIGALYTIAQPHPSVE